MEPNELYLLLNRKLWTPDNRNRLFKILADEAFWKSLPSEDRDKMAIIVKDCVPRFTKKQRPRITLMTQKYPPPDEDKPTILSDSEMYSPIHNDRSDFHPLHSDFHWEQSPYESWGGLAEPFGSHFRESRIPDHRVLEKENLNYGGHEPSYLKRVRNQGGYGSSAGGIPFDSLQYHDRNNSPPVFQQPSSFWRRREPAMERYESSNSERGMQDQRSDTNMTFNSEEEENIKADPGSLTSDSKSKMKQKKRAKKRRFPPSRPAFDITGHLDRIYDYLIGESEPVPSAQMESMFPLPNSCKERSLVKLLTSSDRFRSLTVNGVVCITLDRSTKAPLHDRNVDANQDENSKSESDEDDVKEQMKESNVVQQQQKKPKTFHWLSNSRFEIERWQRGCPLFDHKAKQTDMHFLPECARLGMLQPSMSEKGDCIYLNIHEPFCGVMVGVQGAGKSHTTNCIIENCMIDNPPVTKIKQPLSTLVFHYDQNEDIACEAASLTTIGSDQDPNPNSVLGNLVVLVSPGNFQKRYHKYRELPNCKVYPLLLGFSRLGVVQLKQLMNVGKDEHQLYMQVVMAVLRRRQKAGWPAQTFEDFKEACLEQRFLKQQSNPLRQRLQLLESFLYDTEENEAISQEAKHRDLTKYFQPGTMVICDFTDPLIDPQGANCMFQVILSLFIEKRMKCGKLVVFDEAHKYLDRSVGNLCDDVTHLVRQMRHYGVRVLVSTQNPMVLPHELLELCSFAILHRFFSRVWFDHLRSRLNLSHETLQECCNLRTGEAVVYCSQSKILQPAPISVIGPKTYRCLIRERMTRDNGITIVNEI